MTDLVSWLLEQITEDERDQLDEHWYGLHQWHRCFCGVNDDPSSGCDCDVPSRVLAECAAKRAIIEDIGSRCGEYIDPRYVKQGQRGHWPAAYAPFCDGCAAAQTADRMHQKVLRLLAVPYSGRAGYREEWKPQ